MSAICSDDAHENSSFFGGTFIYLYIIYLYIRIYIYIHINIYIRAIDFPTNFFKQVDCPMSLIPWTDDVFPTIGFELSKGLFPFYVFHHWGLSFTRIQQPLRVMWLYGQKSGEKFDINFLGLLEVIDLEPNQLSFSSN